MEIGREMTQEDVNFFTATGAVNVSELLSHPAIETDENSVFETPLLTLRGLDGKSVVGTVEFGQGDGGGYIEFSVKLQKDSPDRLEVEESMLAVHFEYGFDGEVKNGKFVVKQILPLSATLTYGPGVGDSEFLLPAE